MKTVFDVPELEISREMVADDVNEWDSVTHIDLIMNVETSFGVRFKNSEIAKLENVGSLIDLIEKHLNSK
jgi:acyl carrier protein